MPSNLTCPTARPIVRIVAFVPARGSTGGRSSNHCGRKAAHHNHTVTGSFAVVSEKGRESACAEGSRPPYGPPIAAKSLAGLAVGRSGGLGAVDQDRQPPSTTALPRVGPSTSAPSTVGELRRGRTVGQLLVDP